MHKGRPGSTVSFTGEVERNHVWMFLQEGMDCLAQLPDAFAMDDADFEDAFLPARTEIFGDDFLHVPWTEGVQVEHAINRQRDGFGHILDHV